ncbi:MAG: hypothetical protein HC797_07055 [Anaerolineales bacterium]|nr:hypothetical protein [Anaerolineales bacterium]
MAEINLTIDNKEVTAEEGKTLLEVARENGGNVPVIVITMLRQQMLCVECASLKSKACVCFNLRVLSKHLKA